jgi:hypothetical protein
MWRCLSISFLVAAASLAPAHNFPFLVYSAYQDIAPGVRWRNASSSAPNPTWQICIIEVDLSTADATLVPAVKLSSLSTERTTAIAARFGAVAAINAGYFGSGVSYSHFERHNTISSFSARAPRSAFGLSTTFPPTLAQTPVTGTGTSSTGDTAWATVTEAIGGGPSIVNNGQVEVRSVEESFDAQSGIGPDVDNPRTALGWNGTSQIVWLVTVDGRQPGWSDGMTLDELARLMVDLGSTRAINYDGGGSTTCVVNGTIVNRPSSTGQLERAVNSAWLILPRNTVDNEDPGFSSSGTWGASANAGFFGTNSLVKAGGGDAGTGEARWSTSLAKPGIYRVEARWIASGNRLAAAQYEVDHVYGTASVTRDQRTGSGWVSLGQFPFAAGEVQVRLSDRGPANQFASADAVRWIRIGDVVGSELWMVK